MPDTDDEQLTTYAKQSTGLTPKKESILTGMSRTLFDNLASAYKQRHRSLTQYQN